MQWQILKAVTSNKRNDPLASSFVHMSINSSDSFMLA